MPWIDCPSCVGSANPLKTPDDCDRCAGTGRIEVDHSYLVENCLGDASQYDLPPGGQFLDAETCWDLGRGEGAVAGAFDCAWGWE